jgi:hypothetical protein
MGEIVGEKRHFIPEKERGSAKDTRRFALPEEGLGEE